MYAKGIYDSEKKKKQRSGIKNLRAGHITMNTFPEWAKVYTRFEYFEKKKSNDSDDQVLSI